MDGFVHGVHSSLAPVQSGSIERLPDLPKTIDAHSTADYIHAVLRGDKPVPEPIAKQVEHILHLVKQITV